MISRLDEHFSWMSISIDVSFDNDFNLFLRKFRRLATFTSRLIYLDENNYLIDFVNNYIFVSKIKSYMFKYKQLYDEIANDSLNQLSFIW